MYQKWHRATTSSEEAMATSSLPDNDKLMLRLPPGMRTAIKIAAARNRRSANSEVIFHLERIFGDAARAEAPSQNK